MLTVAVASLLCISTPSTETYNHFNELLANGKVRKLEVTLSCERCKLEGKPDMCKHKEDDIPSWSSREVRDWIKSVYGEARREQYIRENIGVNARLGVSRAATRR